MSLFRVSVCERLWVVFDGQLRSVPSSASSTNCVYKLFAVCVSVLSSAELLNVQLTSSKMFSNLLWTLSVISGKESLIKFVQFLFNNWMLSNAFKLKVSTSILDSFQSHLSESSQESSAEHGRFRHSICSRRKPIAIAD